MVKGLSMKPRNRLGFMLFLALRENVKQRGARAFESPANERDCMNNEGESPSILISTLETNDKQQYESYLASSMMRHRHTTPL